MLGFLLIGGNDVDFALKNVMLCISSSFILHSNRFIFRGLFCIDSYFSFSFCSFIVCCTYLYFSRCSFRGDIFPTFPKLVSGSLWRKSVRPPL